MTGRDLTVGRIVARRAAGHFSRPEVTLTPDTAREAIRQEDTLRERTRQRYLSRRRATHHN